MASKEMFFKGDHMRFNAYKFAQAGYDALNALDAYANDNSLERPLLELVKLRASQINGCTYCIAMHSKDGVEAGHTHEKLHLLSAWRLAKGFSDRERAALEWAEALTLVSSSQISDAIYDQARTHFSEAELVDLAYAVIAVNAWNRMQVAFRM
jgi:AhpD family alkylhydroperoxidase